MRLKVYFLLIGLVLLGFDYDAFAGAKLSVQSRGCDLALKVVSRKTRQLFRSHHFVFVGGFTGDLVMSEGYFKSAVRLINELGGDSTVILPPSTQPVAKNTKLILDTVARAHRETGKPVILIGHSKGGGEVFASLGLPEMQSFVEEGVLAKAISVQGVVRGTNTARRKLTDTSLGWDAIKQFFETPFRSILSTVFYKLNPIGFVIGRVERYFFGEALQSMTPAEMDRLANETGICQRTWDGTLYFFASSGNRFPLISNNDGPHDGVLELSCQFRDDLGRLLTLDNRHEQADHFDLFVAWHTSKSYEEWKQKMFLIELVEGAFKN